MLLDMEYYNKFPKVLKNALIDGIVSFPNSIQQNYDELTVYRGVRYSKDKTIIDKTDFLSNVERNLRNPMVPADHEDISNYSCSCYLKLEEMRTLAKFPRKNKAIAKGKIKKEFGPIDVINKTSHIDLYLFEGIDPSDEFEVIEKWEKNG